MSAHDQVLAAVVDATFVGLSEPEIVTLLNRPMATIALIRRNLLADGFIKDTGHVQQGANKQRHPVYVATPVGVARRVKVAA